MDDGGRLAYIIRFFFNNPMKNEQLSSKGQGVWNFTSFFHKFTPFH